MLEARSSTLMAALAVSPLLFSAPSSTAAEHTGNLSVGFRSAVKFARPSQGYEDDQDDEDTVGAVFAVTGATWFSTSGQSDQLIKVPHSPLPDEGEGEAEHSIRVHSADEYSVTAVYEPDGLATFEQGSWAVKNSRRALPAVLKLEAELAEYAALSEDWDDAGASPPSPEAVDIARAVLKFSLLLGASPKRSYVSPSGEIGLVWSNAAGYADLSFLEDGTISYYVRSADGGQEEYSDRRVLLSDLKPEVWSLLRTL